jgi:hypothetical protein
VRGPEHIRVLPANRDLMSLASVQDIHVRVLMRPGHVDEWL